MSRGPLTRGRGEAIDIAAFIAVLAAWPIVVYVAGRHSPDAIPMLAVASLAFMIGCAIILRSWSIGGTLIGLCIGILVGNGGFMAIPLDDCRLQHWRIARSEGGLFGV